MIGISPKKHPNSVIGATRGDYPPGHYVVMMCRVASEEYREVPIVVLREATYEEYRDWHVQEGLPFSQPDVEERYYEFLMD